MRLSREMSDSRVEIYGRNTNKFERRLAEINVDTGYL